MLVVLTVFTVLVGVGMAENVDMLLGAAFAVKGVVGFCVVVVKVLVLEVRVGVAFP